MANEIAPRDPNYIPVILGVSSVDLLSPTKIAVNPITHAILVESSGGSSGTQYTNGATLPTDPIGTGIIYSNGGTAVFVSAANPLPVTASFSPSGTQDVNLTKVAGVSFALGQQLAAASLPVVLTAAQITTLTPVSTAAQLEVSGTITGNNQNAFSQDATGYRSISITMSGTWSGNLQTQGSNDNTNWFVTNLIDAQDSNNSSHDFGDNRIWYGPVTTRYVRVRSTSFAGTSVTVVAEFSSQANSTIYDRTGTEAQGDRDNDDTDQGKPVKIGFQARSTYPSAVASADRVNSIADLYGRQVVTGSIRALKANQVTTITASASETTIVTAVASTFLDLYGLIVTNTSATAVTVAIKDATAGTTRLNIAVPAGDTRGFMLPESAAIKQTAVNNNWTATTQSVTSVIITALTVQNL